MRFRAKEIPVRGTRLRRTGRTRWLSGLARLTRMALPHPTGLTSFRGPRLGINAGWRRWWWWGHTCANPAGSGWQRRCRICRGGIGRKVVCWCGLIGGFPDLRQDRIDRRLTLCGRALRRRRSRRCVLGLVWPNCAGRKGPLCRWCWSRSAIVVCDICGYRGIFRNLFGDRWCALVRRRPLVLLLRLASRRACNLGGHLIKGRVGRLFCGGKVARFVWKGAVGSRRHDDRTVGSGRCAVFRQSGRYAALNALTRRGEDLVGGCAW